MNTKKEEHEKAGKKILLYGPCKKKSMLWVSEIVSGMGQKNLFDVQHSIEDLKIHLKQPMDQILAAVLIAEDSLDFEEILSLKGLMDSVKVILILPDSETETLRKGFALFPRFISTIDRSVQEIISILNKVVIGRQCSAMVWKT